MRTLGIDLASQDKNTAACKIDWKTRETTFHHPISFPEMLAFLEEADHSAIDAPFGWPDAFRQEIEAWTTTGAWTIGDGERDDLRFRETDRSRDLKGIPLSVTSDRIAITAMRCAHLLAEHHRGRPLDRVGGRVVEAYPAAALRTWCGEIRGYKRDIALRRGILVKLQETLGLNVDTEVCVETDHALDAFVCALVARAAAKRRTNAPREPSERVRREGWIHVPQSNLKQLL